MPSSCNPAPMRMSAPATLLAQSSLLASMPADVHERLLPHFSLVELAAGQELGTRNCGPVRAIFPLAGVLSLVQELPNGDSGQVAVVGREGLLGLPLFMGGDGMPTRAVVQCAGYGLALGREELLQEFERGGPFMRHLLRYTQALITQISLLVLCNRHHSIEQQLCRVILMSLDRVHGHEVPLTQEFVARLLGVRREGVTEASGRLREAGVVACRRGVFAVQDRNALEARACGCYHAARREYTRLFPVNELEGVATTPLRPALAPVPATGWRQLADLGGQAASA
ncbi:MAG: Crp/Fnr family transcriptional regulator [Ramlibacter sp.]|nr:Crp/Fnr family transcriptional regulator [Ramlibacter sp.]